MWFDPTNLLILAQEQAESTAPWFQQTIPALLMLIGAIILSIVIGVFWTRSIRMEDYGWKVAVMISAVLCSIIIIAAKWEPKLGVDLKGGVTYIGQLIPDESGDGVPVAQIIAKIKKRLDPTGTKEIVVRSLGDDHIEIIIPDVENDQEADRIWRRAVTAGYLKFKIVASSRGGDQASAAARAKVKARSDAQNPRTRKLADVESDGEVVASWVAIGREMDPKTELRTGPFTFVPNSTHLVRDGRTGLILDPPSFETPKAFTDWALGNGHENVDILVLSDRYNVEGEDIASVWQGVDQTARPCVNFRMGPTGAKDFGKLTSRYESELLGIVLDNTLLSAPEIRSKITTNGQITGRFTNAEVQDLVGILKAGKLPAAINENWISKDRVDSTIGRELRDRGVFAIGISLILVMVFMVIYYRFAGVVACLALLTNLALILAMIMLIKQPITLTGLAGLVLTVGMSVDANVLVFERMREEIDKGSNLRMAIRNGFGRATVTIVDANLTTLITALVLYAIGTEQIRGFCVALILGIIMSMFTAIFCSRVTFDIAERRGWLKKLSFFRIKLPTSIDFVGKRYVAMATSSVLIVIGLIGAMFLGDRILGHDLRGGTTARVVFNAPKNVQDVRDALANAEIEDHNGEAIVFEVSKVTGNTDDFEADTVFKIDSSLQPFEGSNEEKEAAGYKDLQTVLIETFPNQLAMYSVEVGDIKTVAKGSGGAGADPIGSGNAISDDANANDNPIDFGDNPLNNSNTSGGGTDNSSGGSNGDQGNEDDQSFFRSDLPSDSMIAGTGDLPILIALQDPDSPPQTNPPGDPNQDDTSGQDDGTTQNDTNQDDGGDQGTAAGGSETPIQDADAVPNQDTDGEPIQDPSDTQGAATEDELAQEDTEARYEATAILTFSYPQTADGLKGAIVEQAQIHGIGVNEDDVVCTPASGSGDEPSTREWEVTITSSGAQNAEVLLGHVKSYFESQPYFRSISGVGGQIARESQLQAAVAVIFSLIGIIIYVWFRFQKVTFGLAAVVALVHDVLFVLGAIAITAYVADLLGYTGISSVKITLPVVAAFLTIIGYSLNDTIVVFDRIREVRGKNPDITGEMINKSIGQTLSRTILTSLTTFIVVFILLVGGGDAIQGFAFALVVGVLVGTFSSIFVASPVLLWLSQGPNKAKASKAPA